MFQEGQTSAPGREDSVDYHYVCFVNVEGQLLELDGRKKGPVVKGPCDKEWLLFSSSKLKCLISKVGSGSNEIIDRAGSGSMKIPGADELKSSCCDSIAFTYKMCSIPFDSNPKLTKVRSRYVKQ